MKQRARGGLIVGMVCVVGLTALMSAPLEKEVVKGGEEWRVFRGNAQQTGVAQANLPDSLKILWQFKVGEGTESTPALADGVAYIGAYDGHLYALDLKTGLEKWRYKAGAFKVPVAIREQRVYAGDEDGLFHCLDARTGQKLWKFEVGAEITSGASFVGDNVLFGAGNENLYCLNKDGEKRWSFRVEGGPVNATPAIAANSTFVAGCDSNLHVIDVTTGKEMRTVSLNGQVGATAAVVEEMLYVGTMTNEVLAIDWKAGKIVWTFQPARNQQPFFSSVAVADDLIIAGCKNKRVYGLDRKTGKEVWSFLCNGKVDSSSVVVGKRVYVGSMDRHLYVLDAAKGRQIQKIELDSEVLGSPAVASNRLVIGTLRGTVYCLGE